MLHKRLPARLNRRMCSVRLLRRRGVPLSSRRHGLRQNLHRAHAERRGLRWHGKLHRRPDDSVPRQLRLRLGRQGLRRELPRRHQLRDGIPLQSRRLRAASRRRLKLSASTATRFFNLSYPYASQSPHGVLWRVATAVGWAGGRPSAVGGTSDPTIRISAILSGRVRAKRARRGDRPTRSAH